MSGFHEVLFPLDISLNAEGGPTRRTDIVTLASGREERNSPWAGSRRSYNAGYGVRSLADIETIVAFFEARHGRLYGFRFRDPFDHASVPPGAAAGTPPAASDQPIGTGDGETTVFQLTKRYASGGHAYVRPIAKPVAGSVLLAIDGAPTTAFSLDETTGNVTFDAAPAAGADIAAGFLFDTPVRFDTDSLRINLAAFAAGDIPSAPLIEVAP
ncbi:MAG: TIGR02217 family protein [Alphaproteobacteria bacterium]|nr:TIGR02217 family protein [Alphaproteobacteria bacterium]